MSFIIARTTSKSVAGVYPIKKICSRGANADLVSVKGSYKPDVVEILDVFPVTKAIAHEMGHGLGILHDKQTTCCTNCIMNPIYHNATTEWSDCSVKNLQHWQHECAIDVPPPGTQYAICGNGIVEFGEDCDCFARFADECTKVPRYMEWL